MINTYKTLDFLNLGDRIGKGKSFVFYSCMIFAIFNLLIALILILAPMNDPQIKNNNLMIFSRRIWARQQDLQKDLMDNQILLKVSKIKSNKSQEKEINKKLFSQSLISNKAAIQSDDYLGMANISHEWTYTSSSEEFKFSFYLNEIKKSQKFIQNDTEENQLNQTARIQQQIFNYEDMISQGMCYDKDSCYQNCLKNKNKIEEVNGEQMCEGTYQLNSICAVMDFSEQQIIKGCYKNGKFEKYSFIQSDKQERKKLNHFNQNREEQIDIKFEIYDKHDPHVKALEISQTYEPYQPTVSEYQQAAKYFFLFGGVLSIAILFIYTVVSSSQKKEEEQPLQEMTVDPTSAN